MDIEKIVLKYKSTTKGDQVIAYCEEYPQLQGMGKDEGSATAHFWRAFNKMEDTVAHEETLKKKADKIEAEKQGKKKKAA